MKLFLNNYVLLLSINTYQLLTVLQWDIMIYLPENDLEVMYTRDWHF